ncbi:hypothetical protein BDV19DRAFT_395398 [Aspergillus venezuelensis]
MQQVNYQDTRVANNERANDIDHLPTSLLDVSADLNLEMDKSFFQPEIHALGTPFDPSAPDSQLRAVDKVGRGHGSEISDQAFLNDFYDFSLPITMPSPDPGPISSLGEFVSLRHIQPRPRSDMTFCFEHASSNSASSDGQESSPGFRCARASGISIGPQQRGGKTDVSVAACPNMIMRQFVQNACWQGSVTSSVGDFWSKQALHMVILWHSGANVRARFEARIPSPSEPWSVEIAPRVNDGLSGARK